jgi:hypothetical protein
MTNYLFKNIKRVWKVNGDWPEEAIFFRQARGRSQFIELENSLQSIEHSKFALLLKFQSCFLTSLV